MLLEIYDYDRWSAGDGGEGSWRTTDFEVFCKKIIGWKPSIIIQIQEHWNHPIDSQYDWIDWIIVHCNDRVYTFNKWTFMFESEEDATAFKLRWN